MHPNRLAVRPTHECKADNPGPENFDAPYALYHNGGSAYRMKSTIKSALLLTLLWGGGASAAPAFAQGNAAATQAQPSADSKSPAAGSGDAYYYFTTGHLAEQQYELTNNPDMAAQAVDAYKKALDAAPDTPTIMERLAEIYAKSQRIRDAVSEAQQVVKVDPDNVPARRLLARIYVRTLGDTNAGASQQENLARAVEQFQAILKIQPDDSFSALWLARLYRFENRHDDAEKVLRGVLEHESDNGPALEQLSQLLVDEGRSQDAIDLLEKAADDSSSPDIYDLLGDAYSQQKNYAKAEEAYQKAVDGDPDDPGHRHGLAQALLSQDKFAPALEQYTKLSQLEPGTAENYLRIAQLDRRLGKFAEAESSLLKAKQLSPGSLEVLYNEALLYEDQGRYDDAVKVLTDAIAGIKSQTTNDDNSNALAILYEQLGHAYREQKKYDQAVLAYRDMQKLGPDSQKRGQLLLIDTYRDSHQVDAAITEAKKALDASPKDPGVTVSLALLYGEKSEPAQGTKLLEGLLQGNDSDQEIYIDIAQVQERGKQFPEAEQSAQKAEQISKQPGEKESAWYMLGAIYERQKKYELAEQQFKKVLEANPNNGPVLNYYGYMLANRGIRLEEATSYIQHAVDQDPNNGAYLDSLGWAYYKQNKLPEAQDYLEKAVGREGSDPTILSHLGDVYLKMGRNDRAAELFEQSLAQWQKAMPADYEQDKVNEIDSQLKTLKKRLAQKSNPDAVKPQ
jgi:tetratricopeptide (TPR) repeat protein